MTENETKIFELIERKDLFVSLRYPFRGSGVTIKYFFTESGVEFSSRVAARLYNQKLIVTSDKLDKSWNGGTYLIKKNSKKNKDENNQRKRIKRLSF